MTQRKRLAVAVALALLVPVAQADIYFTDPYEKLEPIRSGADWGSGTGGNSALGQLEGITGQTVDRSSGSRPTLPSRPPVYAAPSRAAAAKARANAAAVDAMAASVMVFSLLQAMEAQSDAAARAAAEAERQRQIEAERQRQLRLQAAARQRAEWERQDAQEGGDLGSIFSNTGGTAFFGMPGVVDPSVLGMGKTGGGAGAPELPRPFAPPPPLPPQLNLLEKGQAAVKETATSLLKTAAKASMPQQLENSKEAVEYFDRANDFIGELFKAMSPESVVKALVDPDPESSQHLLATLQRMSARASRLAFDQDTVNAGEIETAATLLSGGTASNEELQAMVEERMKSSLVDKLWGRFTGED